MIGRTKPIVISTPQVSRRSHVTRITANVDGQPLWFESLDASLHPSIEAFASALLLQSQHAGRPLQLESHVSERWRRHVTALLPIWRKWWGYDIREPICDTRSDRPAEMQAIALMFSAGVDSFYSLFHGPYPDYVVAVHGFDIALDDRERASFLERALRESARDQECAPIFIRTNLREHPAAGTRSLWDRAHGGGLAAIGHLLSDRIDKLVISSSYSNPVTHAWGSTPQTDSLLAGDGFRIRHFGGDVQREDRVSAIAKNPLVRKHLRVCWQNASASTNCSRCEKCVITMMHLAERKLLDEFDCFDGGTAALAERIDQLPLVHREFNVMSRIAARGLLDAKASRSLERLLKRSRRAAPLLALKARLASF